MNPRLTLPESGNPYYNTVAARGYSRAILGSPTVEGRNTLRNCVGYAYGRFHEIAQRKEMDLFDPVNAENIYGSAGAHGLKLGAFPDPGAAIVWQKGATLNSSDGAGHIAIVEMMHPSGEITTSESGWNAKADFWTETRKPPYLYAAGYKLLGFIYQPGAQFDIQKGDSGQVVAWIQGMLIARGYLREGEADGDFGKITLGAVLAFQLEHGLKVDGIAGYATRTALMQIYK